MLQAPGSSTFGLIKLQYAAEAAYVHTCRMHQDAVAHAEDHWTRLSADGCVCQKRLPADVADERSATTQHT